MSVRTAIIENGGKTIKGKAKKPEKHLSRRMNFKLRLYNRDASVEVSTSRFVEQDPQIKAILAVGHSKNMGLKDLNGQHGYVVTLLNKHVPEDERFMPDEAQQLLYDTAKEGWINPPDDNEPMWTVDNTAVYPLRTLFEAMVRQRFKKQIGALTPPKSN